MGCSVIDFSNGYYVYHLGLVLLLNSPNDWFCLTDHCDPTRRDVDGLTALDHAEKTRNRHIWGAVAAYDWRFRRRIGQSRASGLCGALLDRLRHDEDVHRKVVAFLPVLLYLFIGEFA